MKLDWPAPPIKLLWAGGCLLLFAVYTIVFMSTLAEPFAMAAADAAANVIPLSVLAIVMHSLLRSSVMPRPVAVQMFAHVGLAIAFTITWYALLILLLALNSGLAGNGFVIRAFSRPAFTWQLFQGGMLYVTVAAVCYAIRGGREAASVTIISAPPLERYLTRIGDDMVPIDVRDIVTIVGAQDYAEVATVQGTRHLVRLSLGEFERRLDETRFLRVHRSTIVNFSHLARAEPAGGGRMLAHMANGDVVQVSRAGAQSLRTLIV